MDTVEQIFEKIMIERNWDKQQLAEYIGVHPSVLSQKLGTQWNAHWRIFVKLLPDLIDGIRRRIVRIESALMTLKDSGSHFLLPLQLPERWRKS